MQFLGRKESLGTRTSGKMLHMRVVVCARARACAGPLRRGDFLHVRCVEATFPPAAFAFAKLESPSRRGQGRGFRGGSEQTRLCGPGRPSGSSAWRPSGAACSVRPEGADRSGLREGGWAQMVSSQFTRAPGCPQLAGPGRVEVVGLTVGQLHRFGCTVGPEDSVQALRNSKAPDSHGVTLSVHQHPCSVCGSPSSLPLRHRNGLVLKVCFCFFLFVEED